MITFRCVIAFTLLTIYADGKGDNHLLVPFLKAYCIDCHGPDKQKGDRRFDRLTGNFSNINEAETFQES